MTNSVIVSVFLAGLMNLCNGACYFSQELQGDYVMQNTVSTRGFSTLTTPEVQYSDVNVTEFSIPIWGDCHMRVGNHVILVMNSGGTSCYRCFHFKLRSRNVLHVLTAGKEYLSKCDTNEATAINTCPPIDTPNNNLNSEIILFKKKDVRNELKKVYCPIYKKYSFTYNINDGSENNIECTGNFSNLNSCPSGSTLNLNFRKCSFQNNEIIFECLGSWDGPHNQTYLALLRSQPSQILKSHYQCALYREDPNTGIIKMALSNDSTCTSELHNATNGYETLTLTPIKHKEWPRLVTYKTCRFPEWIKGTWQHLSMDDENTLIYKDHSSFKTYTIKCLEQLEDRYLIFSRTQCGEEMYNCIWLKKRSTNVLEFKLGTNYSSNYNNELCLNKNFNTSTWITQGRLSKSEKSPCPVAGDYTGVMPDDMHLCTELSSNCLSLELMHYKVWNCTHRHEILEEREYSCLGQWKENGLIYTYTQRQDVAADIYECFVGYIISDNEINIKEAGEHCQRHVKPLKFGMSLTKNISCVDVNMSSQATTQPVTKPVSELTTKPWLPVTYVPSMNIENSGCNISKCKLYLFIIILTCLKRA